MPDTGWQPRFENRATERARLQKEHRIPTSAESNRVIRVFVGLIIMLFGALLLGLSLAALL